MSMCQLRHTARTLTAPPRMFLLTMATMTLHFTVKNLAAEELRLHTSESMVTLSDLRRAVEEHWGLPAELQRFVCSGRNYWRHDGATPLSSVLDGTSDGPDRERLIWLMWMRKEDYTCAPDGGMFLQSEYEAKQALYQTRNKPFHPVTLGRFLALHTRSLSTWHTFHHGDSWIDNPIVHDAARPTDTYTFTRDKAMAYGLISPRDGTTSYPLGNCSRCLRLGAPRHQCGRCPGLIIHLTTSRGDVVNPTLVAVLARSPGANMDIDANSTPPAHHLIPAAPRPWKATPRGDIDRARYASLEREHRHCLLRNIEADLYEDIPDKAVPWLLSLADLPRSAPAP